MPHFCTFVHFENGPKHSAQALSNTPKHKKTGMCLREEIIVLDKLHSG